MRKKKKIKLLEVWYYPDYKSFYYVRLHTTFIKPEEFDSFRKSVYSLIKVKRVKIKL